MTATADSSTTADAGAPRVEVARTKDGTRTWRVVAVAEDNTEAALQAAEGLAVKIDGQLAGRYGSGEGSQGTGS